MSELPEPSQWFIDRFGDHSLQVMLALANAGRAAHERSLDAKAGSQLATNEAYGSFWVSLPEEVVAHLDFLPEREVVRPGGSRYELVVFEGTLIFPAKCGRGSSGADRINLGQSRFRHRVLSLDGDRTDGPSRQLDFDFGTDDALDIAIEDGSFGSATQVSLVAYDVSPRGGVQHVYVGDATLGSTGLVTWQYREELPLVRLDAEGATVVGLNEIEVTRFDNAPLPENDLTLRRPGEMTEVEGNEAPDAKDEDQR